MSFPNHVAKIIHISDMCKQFTFFNSEFNILLVSWIRITEVFIMKIIVYKKQKNAEPQLRSSAFYFSDISIVANFVHFDRLNSESELFNKTVLVKFVLFRIISRIDFVKTVRILQVS